MLCALVCAGAHLGQSGLFVADLMFADGRQLLQRVPVVGECPCQPRKLGPSCRDEMWNTTFVTTECAIRPSVRVDRVHGDSKDVTGVTKYSHCRHQQDLYFLSCKSIFTINRDSVNTSEVLIPCPAPPPPTPTL